MRSMQNDFQPTLSWKELLQLAADAENEPAEAEKFLDQAVAAARNNTSELALVCSRFGAFLRRQGRESEALLMFPASAGETPRVDQFEVVRLKRAKDAIIELQRDGVIFDEMDALRKISDYKWLRANGMDSVASILMGSVGSRACRMVFGETVSVESIAADFDQPR